ncbi:amidohydrolase [Shewanella saliphila]|uniref:Amidohydrolase n=2 Tax=Shewanella saliphila TaxID=2282698 RepID=A0ABQ2Q3N1_9GAMM|nr:amidohydrolase [Shewanella saliphila]MCL1101266.1 amidohydrolase [Shewanella saliphila]GGP47690.1 amidohydrolase [Shewanella saliphila]
MKKGYLALLITLGTCSLSANTLAQTTLVHDVNGYTLVNGKLQTFNAIQFTDDKIDRLFTKDQTLPTANDITTIDGKGKTLLPGLIDAHGHVLSYGLSLLTADLTNTSSEQDAVSRAQAFIKKNPTDGWLMGRGWNQELWFSKQFPSKESLDKAFSANPVSFGRVDGHAIWVNSKALALAGISASTVSPEGGEIVKDEQGNPTGVLIDNAMNLVFKIIPDLNQQQLESTLTLAMDSLASYGLTSVHDAGISINNIKAYQQLAANNAMSVRVNGMLSVEDPRFDTVLKQGHINTSDDMFKVDSVKISADGALGSRGAALIKEYSDQPGHKGLMLYSDEQLGKLILRAMKAGFQVNTHAIGDNANQVVLNKYQSTIAKTDSKALRHRIEHAQILDLADVPRFAQLDVIASVQATHATSDKNMAENRLGKARLAGAYAWRKLLNANAVIANGSDFPIESPNPFFGLHASVTRQDHLNKPLDGWLAGEKLSRIEAFKSFTIDAAYAGHQEQLLGTLESGKKADFILVEDDYFAINPQQIWQNKVIATWVNGRQVFVKGEE